MVLQKKMNEIYKGNANAIIPPIQIQPPSISSVLEMLNVINGILFVHISAQDMENLKEMQSSKAKADVNAINDVKEENAETSEESAIQQSDNMTSAATVTASA